MKKILIIIFVLALLCGCVNKHQLEAGIKTITEEVIIPDMLQDMGIIVTSAMYYEKQKSWPKSIDQLKNFYHENINKENTPKEEEELKINWDIYSLAQLNALPNGDFEIKYEYKSKLAELFGDSLKIGPIKSQYTTSIDHLKVNATVSEQKNTKIILIEVSEKNNGSS